MSEPKKTLDAEDTKVEDPKKTLLTGVGTGAAVGVAATAASVPIIQAVGFTSAGIAAESVAAGMMSSAAIAGGGGVSSGSAVAVLQSIGALGVLPFGIAAATIGGAAVVGLGIAGIVKSCRSFQREYVSAYDGRDRKDGEKTCWIIATEEGIGNVRVCRYNSEDEALAAFGNIWCSRILYNPDEKEVECRGLNRWAHGTIRRVMTDKYFSTSG